jgi:hypothetical protein
MATPIFYDTPEILSDCESSTGWSTGSTSTEFYKQGSNSLTATFRGATTSSTFTVSSRSLVGKHIRLWVTNINTVYMNTKALGGFRIFIYDGTNTGYWYVDGNDTYFGGWKLYVVDVDSAFDSGTCNRGAVTGIGFEYNFTSSPKNIDNTWWDLLCVGDSYTVTGGSSGDPLTFDDIATTDNASGWGMVQEYDGVYILTGGVQFGDGVGNLDCYFSDQGQTAVFSDAAYSVDQDTYRLDIVAASGGGTTDFVMGTESNGRGIGGCTITTAGTQEWVFSASSQYVAELGLYGTTLNSASGVYLPISVVSGAVYNCNFNDCGQIEPQTFPMQYSNIVGADNYGMLLDSTVFDIRDCNFISCSGAIELTASGTYDFYGLQFSGNNYDVTNNVTPIGNIVINNIDSDTNRYQSITGGLVSIQTGVDLTVTVVDTNNDGIVNVQTAIFKTSDNTELMNTLTDGDGIATKTFNYPGSDVPVYIRARKSSGSPRYISTSTTGLIEDTGLSVTLRLQEDSVAT